MKKIKYKIALLFALAAALFISVAAFINVNLKSAQAATSVVNVFTASGEASVLSTKITEDETDKYYTMFSFGYDSDNVSFKRNLAYNWYEEVTVKDGETESKKLENGLFNMEIGFKNTNFKKFVIAFESQQFAKTEEGKTTNYIMFFPAGNGGVKALVTDDKDAEAAESDTVLDCQRININFTEKLEGAYSVTVSNDGEPYVEGKMVNVGGNYAKYSSSSTTPVYPLIFSAQFDKKEDEAQETAQMILFCLNNQKFEVKNPSQVGDNYVSGSVDDTANAVLCLNSEITHLTIGGQIKFDYQVIDVLYSSPSSKLYYYVLKYEDTKKSDVNYNDYKDERFAEVDSDILLDSDRDVYLPSEESCAGFGGGDAFKADMAVKVYAKVTDSSSTGNESYVFLDWYVDDAHKLTVNDYDFIVVGDDDKGVTYNYKGVGLDTDSWQQICADYQKKVDDAASNLSAGSSSYFYLPSAETLFIDNSTPYSNMKISVYYYSDTQSSNTSLATNNMSINVTKPGSYRFTLYATDAAGNNMYYIDKDGEVVEFSSGDIWNMYGDDEQHDLLPWFTFDVDYKGVQFKKKPDKQSTAYVGTTYNSATFEINGVENSYETKYRLFLFDRAAYYAATQTTLSYEQFIEKMDGLFEGDDTRKYFKEIKEVKETDEDYEEFKDYGWSSTSTSFTPQEGNAFYYMRAEVTDTQYKTDPVTCSLAVVASVEAKSLKGDSEWLKNNAASVILLSIAGVSLVAIILLLVIKPKNKEDIDVQYEKEINKKNKSK